MPETEHPESVAEVREGLEKVGYLADERASLVSFLAQRLGKPVLVEGPAGVGKTELAKALSRTTGRDLIRLQCYEGLDEAKALYEWNYRKQLLRIQAESEGSWEEARGDIFSEEFMLTRPLLEAISSEVPVVLLIDEIDKTDQEFEAMLLEVLSDFQITIPEMGPIHAKSMPIVLLTSNNSRELTEALKRRCLYLWLDYPSAERELEIVRLHTPELDEAVAERLVEVIHMIRAARPEEAAIDRRVDRLGPDPAADRRRGHRPQGLRGLDQHHRQAPLRHRPRRRARRREARRPAPAARAPGDDHPEALLAFFEELRSEGVAVGTSEILDAFEALGEVAWTDQRDFREALASTVAKSQEDRRVFELLFDRHFFRAAETGALDLEVTEERHEGSERLDLDELREAIRQAIADGDGDAMRDLARLAITAFGRQGERSGVIGVDVQRIRRGLGLQSRGPGRRAASRSHSTPTRSASSSATCAASSSAGRSSAPASCRPPAPWPSSTARCRPAPPRTSPGSTAPSAS